MSTTIFGSKADVMHVSWPSSRCAVLGTGIHGLELYCNDLGAKDLLQGYGYFLILSMYEGKMAGRI